jgi:hypothetical protein
MILWQSYVTKVEVLALTSAYPPSSFKVLEQMNM